MRHSGFFHLLVVCWLVGCGSEEIMSPAADATVESEIVNEREDESIDTAQFATPTGAVQTLIRAASSQDAEALSRCFADQAAGEFDSFRNMTATAGQLAEFAEFVLEAEILNEEVNKNETSASVKVRFRARDETFDLAKTNEGWKIVDF